MATRSDKAAKVTELEKRLKVLKREHTDTREMVDQMVVGQRKVWTEITQIEDQLKALKSTMPEKIEVTNHALLRYAERHYGLQTEELRREILSKVSGARLGMDEVKIGGFVIKNNTVVTYTPTAADIAERPDLSRTG